MSECLHGQEQDVDGNQFGATVHIGPITQHQITTLCNGDSCDAKNNVHNCGTITQLWCQGCGLMIDEF